MVQQAPSQPAAQHGAQPAVTLDAPAMVMQKADLFARAAFTAPQRDGTLRAVLPDDATFVVRPPSGRVATYPRTHPAVAQVGTALQLATRAIDYGDWLVRVQGTVLVNGQRVVVAAQRLIHVASSPL